MNKFKFTALALFMISCGVMAQEGNSNSQPTKMDSSQKATDQAAINIYQMALRYNDPAVAKSKLYELIEKYPGNLFYAERLSKLYFELEQYSSAALVALDVLKADDENIPALEIAAYSLEQLGALDRALPHFESLHLLSGDLFSLYKTSYLQYSLKKYDEALNSVDMLIKNNKSEEEKLTFPKKDNSTQDVSMKAAALNLKGLIYKEQGSTSEAKAAFEAALANAPEFEIVQDNLKELN
ncbi:tetratricopeptide repeat protein [Echinicola salinicaeni]|uniref:tetratricopeptide repeat protein n=1 Tax=Echinicola salinicaeni TaxID=2762757 RepID=UPI00164815AB|nr:tetratricopeptide repeat protein [Echinicola salinicaeni]